ncbi:MAG TPA: hypothetical protein VEH08_00550 [Methanomassiliicoccales archaeon]|nr:hypothetical protein [Methanomassiliicoccales archaeon]
MRAAVLLDLDEVLFVEPNYERLTDDHYTAMLLGTKATEARLLISEDEWPLALALNTGKEWRVGSFTHRKPSETVIEKVEELDGDVYQEPRKEWEAAVREYYSLQIVNNVPPAVDDFNPKRAETVADLLKERWGGAEGQECLDACCGSGAGSAALRSIGLSPISYDNDPALISLGLRAGRLLPEETVCIDGMKATKLLKSAPFGIMLMAGEITPHNQLIWKILVNEALELAENALFTTGTEKEARLLEQWAKEKNRRTKVFENTRELFYDNWVCDARKA